MPAESTGRPPRAALAFIILTVFIDMLGIGLIVPVLPFLVLQFRSDAFTLGLVSLSYAAAQFLATPILGALSDRYGRRPVLMLSLFGSGLAYIAFGLATALWMLFVARIIDGLTGGNISTAQAFIADITTKEHRSKTMGLMGAALGLGFVIGPAVGGALSHFSLATPVFAAGGLALANTVFGWFVLPESLPPARRTPSLHTGHTFNPLRPLHGALGTASLRSVMLTMFLANFALAGLQSNFALFALTRLGYGPSQVALVFVFLGVMHIVSQGVLVRQAVNRWGDRRTLVIGLALGAVGYAMVALTRSPALLYSAVAVLAVGGGLGTPTLTATISHRVGDTAQGVTLGSAQAMASLARVFGPLWAGYIFDHAGPSYPYATGAVAVLLALALMMRERPAEPAERAEGVRS